MRLGEKSLDQAAVVTDVLQKVGKWMESEQSSLAGLLTIRSLQHKRQPTARESFNI